MKTDPLSWSYSRATLLYYCAKKYYFNYYTSYLKSFDWDFYKECLILKNLSSLAMWIGQMSHGLLSDYLNLLKSGQNSEENVEKLKKNILQEMDEIYEKAKIKDFGDYDKENKFGFSEHFYSEDIDEKFVEGKKRVIRYFEQFLESAVHNEIKKLFVAGNKVFVEAKIPNFDSMKYQIENIPDLNGIILWAQPDLGIIIPAADGQKTRYVIYDRKTGRIPEKEPKTISEQLKIYAYKMLLKIGIDKLDEVEIFCYEVFLENMKSFGGQIHRADIQWIESQIIQDVHNQKKLLVNQNHIKNQPLPIENFARTDSPNKCKYCRFRKVCDELKNYEQGSVGIFG